MGAYILVLNVAERKAWSLLTVDFYFLKKKILDRMSETSPKKDSEVAAVKTEPRQRKFNNGWTNELEILVGDWADRAQCYRWMHDKTSRAFSSYNQYMMIPVIVLSTLTGTANFGLDSFFSDDSKGKRFASIGIGGVSILTGIITTIANFLRYGQGSESHSMSSISWAKFSRLITIELALHPNERMEAYAFLKLFRIELDRLIEQSPTIPESIINRFKHEFRMMADVKRPDITGAVEHTRAFDNKNERLKAVAAEAALLILHKKRAIKDLVLEDIDKRVIQVIADVERARFSVSPDSRNPLRNPTVGVKKKEEQDTIVLDINEDHEEQYDKK